MRRELILSLLGLMILLGPARFVNADQTPPGKGTVPLQPMERHFPPTANTPFVPGELIVRFAPRPNRRNLTNEEKNQVLISLGGAAIKRNYKIVPGLTLVKLPSGIKVEKALQAFNKAGAILYAEPNYEVKAVSTFPNDPRFDELWAMHNTGQTGGTTDADIDAPEAWDVITGSRDIVVAVIDTGVDYNHPDLADNMWVNEPELNGTRGVDDDGNGYVDDIYGYDFRNDDGDPMDDHFHGTHCAGTIGADANNGEGVAGVCWKVRIMALKFLSSGGSGSAADAVSCVQYSALMGANLSSNSWGGGGYSQALADAIDAAGAAGILFVAAAGNKNENTDDRPHYPASYDCESIISVMATDKNDDKSGFSSYGPVSVDLGAPGSEILSCNLAGGYQYLNGTSMAAPHVAGACALVWSMNPFFTSGEVKDILLRTVDPTLPGLCVSEGRLNLYNAIRATHGLYLNRESYSCSDEVVISLFDSALVGQGAHPVTLAASGGDLETVLLREKTPAVGAFAGKIFTVSGTPGAGDGRLQVSHGEFITATYENGTDTAAIDCRPPQIVDLHVDPLGPEPTVTFQTDEPADARALWGPARGGPYNTAWTISGSTTEHTIMLSGVSPMTQYFFLIEAADALGNTVVDDNDGACYAFTTDQGPGDIYVPGQDPTIQKAIDHSWPGGTVWVTDGTYTGPGNRDLDFKARAITLRSENGPNNCIIDCQGTEAEPHRAFYFHRNEDADSVVRGFTITNGFAGYGGALYCTHSSPTIQDCIFNRNLAGRDTSAGGAIYNHFSSPTIKECTFSENSSGGRRSGSGGAIYNDNSSPAATDCTFTANSAGDRLTSGRGGAICNRYNSSPNLTNCAFINNSAGYDATSGQGGAIWNRDNSNPTVTNCAFIANSAGLDSTSGRGGALYCRSINAIALTDCKFVGNSAGNYSTTGDGGAVFSTDVGTVTLANCVITENAAGVGGTTGSGGALSCQNAGVLLLTNCTIASNTAYLDAGGIYLDGSTATLANCILWNNSSQQIYALAGSTTVTYSDVQAGWPGQANIDADPLFIDPANHDYHLLSSSPCIDTGTNEPPAGLPLADLDGAPRPLDGNEDGNTVADMGAYEYWGHGTGRPFIQTSATELTFSAIVDQANPDDRILSIRNWGEGTLNWQITEDCPWLQVHPGSGESAGEFDHVTVSVDISALSWGEYSCVLTVSAPGAINSPKAVHVNLSVNTALLVPSPNYPTIQAAVDAAIDGDTIVVADGNYTGPGNRDIDFAGKAIALQSRNGPENCIINCQGTPAQPHRGFFFHTGEGHASILNGFTITGGYAGFGAAVEIDHASPTIKNCLLIANTAVMYGGGIDNFYSAPKIINCVFNDNAAWYGGGLYNIYSFPTVTNCLFAANTADHGAAVDNEYSSPVLVNCTFTANSAAVEAGGVLNYHSPATITNSIFWADAPDEIFSEGEPPVITYCDIQQTWSPGSVGNINADPLFVNAANGDYHLLPGSPAIDAGDPASDYTKERWPNAGRVNMGAYGNTKEATRSSADFDDLALLADSWLEYEPILDIAPAPVGDGIINFLDFALFADWWLR